MNRRLFFSFSIFLVGVTVVGGRNLKDLTILQKELRSLYNMNFKEAAKNKSYNKLLSYLSNKKVISNNKVNVSIVKTLAKTDYIVGYKGSFYTQTELDLYILSFLLHE